jgi:drug/metabolite transporter (DMT)-like permease
LTSTWGVRASLAAMVAYFGSSFTAYATAERSFGFVTVNAFRFVIAGVILCAAAGRRLRAIRHVFAQVFVAGALGVGMMAILMAYGVDRSSPTLAALVFALESVGVASAAALVARDRPSTGALIGLGVGFAGSVVAAGAVTQPLGRAPVAALVAMLASVVAFSLYTAVVRRVAPAREPLAVAALTQVGAAAFAVPAIALDAADRGITRAAVTPGALLSVAWLGVGSAMAYFLIARVLADAPASRLAVSLYLLPVAGVATAWIVLGQAPYARHLAGGALILAAVWIGERTTGTVSAPG